MAEQANSKLLEGIAYFEKMLKVMPGDRTTLEFLSVAYEQLGDVEKQRTSLIQLAEALLREKDYDAAEAIGERLGGFSETDAQDMVRRIKSVRNPVQLKAVVRPGAGTPPRRAVVRPAGGGALGEHAQPGKEGISLAQVVMSAVKAEAALIRDLYAKNVVDASAAEVVQRHLGGLPEATRPFLVSALAILEKESGGMGEKAAVYMADAASAPPIPPAGVHAVGRAREAAAGGDRARPRGGAVRAAGRYAARRGAEPARYGVSRGGRASGGMSLPFLPCRPAHDGGFP